MLLAAAVLAAPSGTPGRSSAAPPRSAGRPACGAGSACTTQVSRSPRRSKFGRGVLFSGQPPPNRRNPFTAASQFSARSPARLGVRLPSLCTFSASSPTPSCPSLTNSWPTWWSRPAASGRPQPYASACLQPCASAVPRTRSSAHPRTRAPATLRTRARAEGTPVGEGNWSSRADFTVFARFQVPTHI
jgi:hypothetical protein